MFIPTFISIVLIFSYGKARCIIDGLCADSNNWEPFLYMSKDLDGTPNYDITHWVRQLHLQQCAFVEIGEGFCAFCEEIGPWSSIPAKMNSLWSQWSSPKCNNTCGRGYMVAITSCQDQRQACHRLHRARIILVSQNISQEVTLNSLSMMKGVNFSSCPDSFGKCYCEVNMVDGIMRAARFTEPCISTEGCTPSDAGTFTFEGEYDQSGSADFDQVYENDDSEGFEDTIFYSESVRPLQRRLLRVYNINEEEYELRENRSPNKNLKNTRGYRANGKGRLDDDSDYNEEEEDDDDGTSDDSNIGDEGDTDDDDSDDEDEEEIGLKGPWKGRRRPRKRAREPRSDYRAIAFEGKREVDEPNGEGAMQIASAEDDCDDDSTEPLLYYDYGEETSAAAELCLNRSGPLHTICPERIEHFSSLLPSSDWFESSFGKTMLSHSSGNRLYGFETKFITKLVTLNILLRFI